MTSLRMLSISLALLCGSAARTPAGADGERLFNGRDLTGWEVIGNGVWTVMRDGTLVGQRHLRNNNENQSWLYTKKNFGQFDLHLEYWLRLDGNSGVSIRDETRAKYAVAGPQHDDKRTPAHNGYEIQLASGDSDAYPSGSVYLFNKAKEGVQRESDWNTLDVESHDSGIRVKLNGQVVSEYAGEPGRPKTGPIGLQLHDKTTVVMFRNIRLKEIR